MYPLSVRVAHHEGQHRLQAGEVDGLTGDELPEDDAHAVDVRCKGDPPVD